MTVQELHDDMVSRVAAAGGSMLFEDLVSAYDYQTQQRVHQAFQVGKAANTLRKHIVFNNGSVSHEAYIPAGGA